MKKTLLISLLIISGSQTKDMSPDELLKTTQTKKETPKSTTRNSTNTKHTTGDFFRNLGEWFDQAEKQMGESFNAMGKYIDTVGNECDFIRKSAKQHAIPSKQAISGSRLIGLHDEKEAVKLIFQLGELMELTPEESISFEVNDSSTQSAKTFSLELKHTDSPVSLEIIGAIRDNLLTVQVTTKETKEEKQSQSVVLSNSILQRTILAELDFAALTAEFKKENKTLTITIPKKATPEKEVRKIPVIIK